MYDGKSKSNPTSPTNIRNVCGETYLYAPLGPNGKRDWETDEALERLEAALGARWPPLSCGFVHLGAPSLRNALARFVATMHLRTPSVRRQIQDIHADITEFLESAPREPDGTLAVNEALIKGNRYDIDPSEWREFKKWSKDEEGRFFAKKVRSEAGLLASLLLAKRWSIVCADEDSFVTSDRPVNIHHPTERRFGFETPGVQIIFPISPTRILVMDDLHDKEANRYYTLQSHGAGGFNLLIWQSRVRFMITGRPPQQVIEEIERAVPHFHST